MVSVGGRVLRPYAKTLTIRDGDASYNTSGEVIDLVKSLTAGQYGKIWEKTIPAQQVWQWGVDICRARGCPRQRNRCSANCRIFFWQLAQRESCRHYGSQFVGNRYQLDGAAARSRASRQRGQQDATVFPPRIYASGG